MSIDQVTNETGRRARVKKFLAIVDRAALTVLFTMVVAGLPLTAVGLLTQVV